MTDVTVLTHNHWNEGQLDREVHENLIDNNEDILDKRWTICVNFVDGWRHQFFESLVHWGHGRLKKTIWKCQSRWGYLTTKTHKGRGRHTNFILVLIIYTQTYVWLYLGDNFECPQFQEMTTSPKIKRDKQLGKPAETPSNKCSTKWTCMTVDKKTFLLPMSQSLYGLETEYRQAFRHPHIGKWRRVLVRARYSK